MQHLATRTGGGPGGAIAWAGSGAAEPVAAVPGTSAGVTTRHFNLLRWFSIASLLTLIPVAAVTAAILSHFITDNALQRDALLTAQFIRNCLGVEAAQIQVPTLVPYLDPRSDAQAEKAGLSATAVARARAEVFEHLETLPDTLLTNVFAPDFQVVWSTNQELIGTQTRHDEDLHRAFDSGGKVARHYRGIGPIRDEQRFVVQPREFFIEQYIPLRDGAGKVVAVVEVYKEPSHLMAAVRTGQLMVWSITLAGGVVIYLALFSIVRRGSRVLKQQQCRLVEQEAHVFAGEMATALAHSLRNPLASVRSSAELAACTQDLPVRKNAQDIITQVDFLSQWVRDLLLYSRPVVGETEPVDLCAVLASVLGSFGPTFERCGIQVKWDRSGCGHPVQGNTSLLTQALHSVVSNAVEAMPRGGMLRIEIRESHAPPGLDLLVIDTGVGMSPQQLAAAFLPFRTTKSNGLGVGLPMLKRSMERFGGFVALTSTENAGTQVRLHFRT